MTFKIILVVIASILAIIGNIPYLRDVIRGKTEPHAYTWFIWSIVSAVTFFGQLAKGAGIGAIPTAVSESFTLIIFLFSLKYGWKHVTKTDTIFLIIALCGLIPWFLTNDPTISVITVVSIDVVAFIPTIRKTWLHPKTETTLLYGTNAARHLLILFSLQAYNVATMLHSLAMIITNTFMSIAITAGKARDARR